MQCAIVLSKMKKAITRYIFHKVAPAYYKLGTRVAVFVRTSFILIFLLFIFKCRFLARLKCWQVDAETYIYFKHPCSMKSESLRLIAVDHFLLFLPPDGLL